MCRDDSCEASSVGDGFAIELFLPSTVDVPLLSSATGEVRRLAFGVICTDPVGLGFGCGRSAVGVVTSWSCGGSTVIDKCLAEARLEDLVPFADSSRVCVSIFVTFASCVCRCLTEVANSSSAFGDGETDVPLSRPFLGFTGSCDASSSSRTGSSAARPRGQVPFPLAL